MLTKVVLLHHVLEKVYKKQKIMLKISIPRTTEEYIVKGYREAPLAGLARSQA
jgi:hypothetical protein